LAADRPGVSNALQTGILPRVKSLAMLVGTFLITFGMLSVMWLTMAGNPDGMVAASPFA
jgi:hypothetical protein